MIIRYAKLDDLNRLTEVDNYYIENTNATFYVKPRTPKERESWFSSYKESGPYRMLVFEDLDHVQGCAFSSRYRDHFAFDSTIETSVYLAPDYVGRGVGTLLYQKLFSELKNENLHMAVAGVALPNPSSISLHKKLGFTEVGVFEEYAIKRGVYISSMWLQKRLDI